MKPWMNLAASESSTRKQIKKNKKLKEEWVDEGILVQTSPILKIPSLLNFCGILVF